MRMRWRERESTDDDNDWNDDVHGDVGDKKKFYFTLNSYCCVLFTSHKKAREMSKCNGNKMKGTKKKMKKFRIDCSIFFIRSRMQRRKKEIL